jgi:hypothetical protein
VISFENTVLRAGSFLSDAGLVLITSQPQQTSDKYIATGVAASPPTTRKASLTGPSPDFAQSKTLLSERRRRKICLIGEGGVRSIDQIQRF